MRMTNTEHQREIDAFDRKQIMLERQDHEREVEEANNSTLFNIPPDVWRHRWSDLHGEDKHTAASFWTGVYCSSDYDNCEEQRFLCNIALILVGEINGHESDST